jgi:hypothetical protein
MTEAMSSEQFEAALKDVQISILDELVLSPQYQDSQTDERSYTGSIVVTKGLTDLIGFELVSYGTVSVDDLFMSARLIHGRCNRQVVVEIPHEILREIDAQNFVSSDLTYKQATLLVKSDEGEIDQWLPDGGLPLLPKDVFEKALADKFEQQTRVFQERVAGVRADLQANIQQFGYTKIGVFDPEHHTPTFVYTIGLTNHGLPELFVSGLLEEEFLSQLVDHFAHQMLDCGENIPELLNAFSTDETGVHCVRLCAVVAETAVDTYLLQAPIVLKKKIPKVSQIQISDNHARYFGDRHYSDSFKQIPLPLLKSQIDPTFNKSAEDEPARKTNETWIDSKITAVKNEIADIRDTLMKFYRGRYVHSHKGRSLRRHRVGKKNSSRKMNSSDMQKYRERLYSRREDLQTLEARHAARQSV